MTTKADAIEKAAAAILLMEGRAEGLRRSYGQGYQELDSSEKIAKAWTELAKVIGDENAS